MTTPRGTDEGYERMLFGWVWMGMDDHSEGYGRMLFGEALGSSFLPSGGSWASWEAEMAS